MKRRILFITLTIILCVVLLLAGCGGKQSTTASDSNAQSSTEQAEALYTAEKPLELIHANWTPMQMPAPVNWEPLDLIFNEWMDTVEEETGGAVKFTRYPGASLVDLPEIYDAVKTGVCDVALVQPHVNPGEFKFSPAVSLPNIFPSAAIGSTVRQKLIEEGYFDSEWQAVQHLWCLTNSPSDVACRTKQIKTLEDWEGLKVAVMGEPDASTVKALGALPVSIPITEQYIALERGTVDAVWVESNAQFAFKFMEVAKYQTFCNGGIRIMDYVMNRDTYENLPPDIKEVIDRNSGMLWSVYTGELFDATLARSVAYREQMAVDRDDYDPIYTVPDDEFARWVKAWEQVYADMGADLESQGYPFNEMLDRCMELTERYTSYGL